MVDGRERILSHSLRQSLPQTQQLSRSDILRATLASARTTQITLWRNISSLGIVCISATTYIVMAHALGPQNFGDCLFAQWAATVTIPVIGTGMSMISSRQIAAMQSRESPRMIAGIFYFLWYRQHRSILLYCFIYLGLALLLPRIASSPTFSPGLLLLASLATLPSLLSSVAGTTLRSLRRADLLIILNLCGTVLTLLFVLIANQVIGRPVEAFILAFAFSSTFTLIIAVCWVIKFVPLEQAIQPGIFLRERLEQSLKPAWLHFIGDAVVWQRSELLLLACWYTPAQVGFYAISSSIGTWILGMTPALFTRCLFPWLLHYLPRHRYLNPYDAFVKTSCYIIFLAVPICAAIILFSPLIIATTLGPAYMPVVQPLRILLIASAFGSIATVSLTYLTTLEQHVQRQQQKINLVIAAGKILLAFPLIWFWGCTGAALVNTLAQIASALTSISLCRQHLCHHEEAS